MAQRIGIIGAGIAGLSAAWDLANAGHAVTIYEAGTQVGGLAAGFRDESWDWTLEKFYHHWFTGDEALLTLAEEMGVRERVIFKRPKTSYWLDGDIRRSEIELTSVLGLPLSRWGLLRFMMGGAFVKLNPFWQPLENITADRWMQRWMGDEGYEKFFKPLLIGKFGEAYDEVNMAWMWARVQARSLQLGTFEGGFQAFLEALADADRARGVTICLESPVEHIRLGEDLKPIMRVGGEETAFDAVISTTSPRIMLKITEGLADTAYGDQMKALKSIGGLVVVAALKHPLLSDGTYWLNLPADTPDKSQNEFPYLALVEHTNFMDRAHYGGDHLIYMGDYVQPDHEYFQLSEDDLYKRFIPSLSRVNPDFSEDWVRKYWVFRAPYAQPIPTVGHSHNIPDLRTPIPGVYWASMSQIYPWDRGTNYSVELGRRAARIVLDQAPETATATTTEGSA